MDDIRIVSQYKWRLSNKEVNVDWDGAQAHSIEIVEREEKPGQLYVRKVYKYSGFTKTVSQSQQRVLSEYRILSSLHHPHIIPLVDYECVPQLDRWEAYLYMEYCEHGDLSQHTYPGEHLTTAQFWDVSFQLATALLYCHTGIYFDGRSISVDERWREPVLHRDIKPQNVLLSSRSGSKIQVKLCDFGLAKHEKSALTASHVGTPGYYPPEIRAHSSNWSTKADIYCLGVTMKKVICEEQDSRDVEDFFEKCTAADPNSRLTTTEMTNLVCMFRPAQPPYKTVASAAAQTACYEALKNLQNMHENILEEDQHGSTNIHRAAAYGKPESIDCFNQLGLQIGGRDKFGFAPMHVAAELGRISMVNKLLTYGQKVDVKINDGATPMHIAARHGHIALVDHLLVLGHPLTVNTNDGETPIFWAVCGGNVEMVKHLVNLGQNFDVKANNEKTLMHKAAECRRINVMEYLRHLGLPTDAKTCDGETPLHFAALKGGVKMVEYLRSVGENVNVRTNDGRTPRDFARTTGDIEIIAHFDRLLDDELAKRRGKIKTLFHRIWK